jgi:hypothetical protein
LRLIGAPKYRVVMTFRAPSRFAALFTASAMR